ncbi:MAG TPA: cytochrome b N-terminal domain-containing protein [Bryobacteraceae bacterium]
MKAAIYRVGRWFDERTGLSTACRRFLFEDIPASSGWPQVFGSVCLFLFLTQVLTGILLAFNYAPTPGDAYKSVSYILERVAGGKMIHGLHHWGASLMIIAVFLHMAQVFIYGAYKRPREATWIAGVALLLLTLAFGLTGYLLPWDNRAYWGTVVTAQIMASIPFAGPVLTQLIGAANGIGVVTFSRFYALHTLLLPGITGILVAFHIYLVRRHGAAPAPTDNGATQKFYPRQAFRDVIAVFAAFVILFAAAAFLEVPLERIADPTDISYIPRPEWYFLFLFQLLKIFEGKLEVIGTVVLPTLAVLALIVLPFANRVHARMLNGRVHAAAVVLLAFSIWAGLTATAERSTPKPYHSPRVPREAVQWAQIPPEQVAGFGFFRSSNCGSCHNLLVGVPKAGPNLGHAGVQHPKEWLIQHFRSPQPSSPPLHLSLPKLNALSLFVENVRPESVALLDRMSPQYITGVQTFVVSGCISCHKVNGSGGGVGPSLNGLANRRGEQWVIDHFADPQRLSPGSIMPRYQFSKSDEDALLTYLFSLPD